MTAAAFARFATGLAWSDVPGDVRQKLLAHLVDTIAVMCAGAATPEAAALLSSVAAQPGGCRVVTRDVAVAPADAALLNGFAGRRHTFDDTLEAGPIHPGSTVWAASLAGGEHALAPLTRLLTAALTGYELAIRLADALGPGHYDRGFHGTGTCNAPGAGLAAAVAMGLDATSVAHAINLAAGAASGTRQYQVDGSIIHSALNGARAASAGVQSAGFAAAGLDAPAGQLDGKWGLLALFEAPHALATHDLGGTWGLRRLGLKPFPTCRFTHGPIAAFDALRQLHGLTPESVASIDIRTFAQSASVSDRPVWEDREAAILSHQFALAATLREGPPALATLDRLAGDAELRSLAGRIGVSVDPGLERRAADAWPHHLRVTLRDGRVLEAFSPAPPGSLPGDDATPAMRDKVERLIGLGLGAGRLDALRALLAEPERHMAAELTALLGPAEVRHGL
jgi:2-methylcitrate dehydratase PrpD